MTATQALPYFVLAFLCVSLVKLCYGTQAELIRRDTALWNCQLLLIITLN